MVDAFPVLIQQLANLGVRLAGAEKLDVHAADVKHRHVSFVGKSLLLDQSRPKRGLIPRNRSRQIPHQDSYMIEFAEDRLLLSLQHKRLRSALKR